MSTLAPLRRPARAGPRTPSRRGGPPVATRACWTHRPTRRGRHRANDQFRPTRRQAIRLEVAGDLRGGLCRVRPQPAESGGTSATAAAERGLAGARCAGDGDDALSANLAVGASRLRRVDWRRANDGLRLTSADRAGLGRASTGVAGSTGCLFVGARFTVELICRRRRRRDDRDGGHRAAWRLRSGLAEGSPGGRGRRCVVRGRRRCGLHRVTQDGRAARTTPREPGLASAGAAWVLQLDREGRSPHSAC